MSAFILIIPMPMVIGIRQAEGVSCGREWIVMPYAPDINHGGPLYRPCKTGGLDNTGHVLQIK